MKVLLKINDTKQPYVTLPTRGLTRSGSLGSSQPSVLVSAPGERAHYTLFLLDFLPQTCKNDGQNSTKTPPQKKPLKSPIKGDFSGFVVRLVILFAHGFFVGCQRQNKGFALK